MTRNREFPGFLFLSNVKICENMKASDIVAEYLNTQESMDNYDSDVLDVWNELDKKHPVQKLDNDTSYKIVDDFDDQHYLYVKHKDKVELFMIHTDEDEIDGSYIYFINNNAPMNINDEFLNKVITIIKLKFKDVELLELSNKFKPNVEKVQDGKKYSVYKM